MCVQVRIGKNIANPLLASLQDMRFSTFSSQATERSLSSARTVRLANLSGNPLTNPADLIQINTSPRTKRVQSVHQILCRHIACRTRGVRTPTQATDGRVERPHAMFQRDDCVHQRLAESIVEVQSEVFTPDACLLQRLQQLSGPRRSAHASDIGD